MGRKRVKEVSSEISIPVSLLQNRKLAPLEAISEYLKEIQGMSYSEIARATNRNDRTIWTCYNRAKKKGSVGRAISGKQITIPLNLLKNRTLAPLEAISKYLKDQRGMTYHMIAESVNRDDRTIWTCYNRAKKKLARGSEK